MKAQPPAIKLESGPSSKHTAKQRVFLENPIGTLELNDLEGSACLNVCAVIGVQSEMRRLK
jgi:hypothetical protein